MVHQRGRNRPSRARGVSPEEQTPPSGRTSTGGHPLGSEPQGCRSLRIVVCDTGPILHLREADCFSLLQALGSIFIPPMVDAEMADADPLWEKGRPDWIQSVPLDQDHLKDAQSWLRAGLLDPGEAEAVALAAQIGADWLLTDDGAART